MYHFKKIVCLAMLLKSFSGFAGIMGEVCSASNTLLPTEKRAWDISGRALYLQSTAMQPTSPMSQTFNESNKTITWGTNPDWGWGFQLAGAYHFSSGSEVNLNWYHYRRSTLNSITVTVDDGNNLVIPFVGPFIGNMVSSFFQAQWDQANLEFAQPVYFAKNKFLRLHGGLNYSRVSANSTLSNSYVDGETEEESNMVSAYSSSTVFNGFGPRVGADLNYQLDNHIGVYATGAMSLLAGTSKALIGYSTTALPASNNAVGFSTPNVIPELDTKMGFMYNYETTHGALSLDLGWLWAHYVNAIGNYGLSTNRPITSSLTNFGVQGLYADMKWVGNLS